jgi:hypothetical protein
VTPGLLTVPAATAISGAAVIPGLQAGKCGLPAARLVVAGSLPALTPPAASGALPAAGRETAASGTLQAAARETAAAQLEPSAERPARRDTPERFRRQPTGSDGVGEASRHDAAADPKHDDAHVHDEIRHGQRNNCATRSDHASQLFPPYRTTKAAP